MKTQINVNKSGNITPENITGLNEGLRNHSEIERIEFLATVMRPSFKDALTICSVDMLETGKASAFAVYEKPDEIEISDPVLAEPTQFYHFGAEKFYNWAKDTGVNEFLDDQSPKKQKLFYEWSAESDKVVPRNDIRMFVIGFPMGDLQYEGFNARDIRRPTIPLIDMFLQQDQLRSGCVFGILTNDGKQSGMMLFKKNEEAGTVDRHALECFGRGDRNIRKDLLLGQMKLAGFDYAEINLNCPKNRDPDKLYEQRVVRAVETIF